MPSDPYAPPDPDIHLVTVLRSADPVQIAIAKSLLDDAGIDHFVKGEHDREMFGWIGGPVFPTTMGTAEFQVREEDVATAEALLRELETPLPADAPVDDDPTP